MRLWRDSSLRAAEMTIENHLDWAEWWCGPGRLRCKDAMKELECRAILEEVRSVRAALAAMRASATFSRGEENHLAQRARKLYNQATDGVPF